MSEIWKDINGYEGYYQASSFGRVKSLSRKQNHYKGGFSLKKEIILKQRLCRGYPRVTLQKERVSKACMVHRLVCAAFKNNIENKREVNHINGIKTDNRIENLEWCTSSENQIHAFKMGLQVTSDKSRLQAAINLREARSKLVIDLQTGIFYSSAKELSDLIGIKHGTIRSWLSGARPNKTSYKYA